MEEGRRRFAFVFPLASGHLNPSLAIARRLVGLKHEVDYLSFDQFQKAIEDTGSKFHSAVHRQPEMYEGKVATMFGFDMLAAEFGVECEDFLLQFQKLEPIMWQRLLPGLLRWLDELKPHLVLYCPMMNQEAAFASEILKIPSVALLTVNGPGATCAFYSELLESSGLCRDATIQALDNFQALQNALLTLNEHGLGLQAGAALTPLGRQESMTRSKLTIVTSCGGLQDDMHLELGAFYSAKGVVFEAVGPLLDQEGSVRAAGYKFANAVGSNSKEEDLVLNLQEARKAGRKVILVSMGTVITGDSDLGWMSRQLSASGCTGRELCQAVWGAAFDACGTESHDLLPLLLVALGPQPDALRNLHKPQNSICSPSLPQVDLLRAGVDVFLTHGGQNSFMEALAAGVPVVVCPGHGDQNSNALRAVSLGVGLQVSRPEVSDLATVAEFRKQVAASLLTVLKGLHFKRTAENISKLICDAGGVSRAVQLVCETAREV